MAIEEQTDKALADLLKARGRLGRILTSSSLVLLVLYGLGFIYLKSYLAVFGFQIELANLSIPNLLLAHRFFVSQHVFIAAGVAQAFLLARLGRAGLRAEPLSAIVVIAFPILLLAVTFSASFWSEPNTPIGFDIRAPRLWAPLGLGWLCGWLCHWVVAPLVKKRRLSMGYAARCVLALAIAAVSVSSYRVYALVTASNNLENSRLQFIEIEADRPTGGGQSRAVCGVVYADSQDFFLLCGDSRLVVSREEIGRYTVEQSDD